MPNGVLLESAIIVNSNDPSLNISPNLRAYAFDYSLSGKIVPPTLVSNSNTYPAITINSTSKSGVYISGYSDIFYNRIWIIPTVLNLNGVPQLYSTSVIVWNSYFTSKTLSSVTPTDLTGINITGQTSGPYNPLQYKTYVISLGSEVGASVDGFYTFNFSNAEDPKLDITGTLAMAFPYKHNWNSDWVETYSLKTGLIESHNGKEQVYKLTANPRRLFNMEVLLADRAGIPESNLFRSKFYNSMAYGKAKSWIVPIWSDVKLLDYEVVAGSNTISVNTSNTDFKVGGYLYLYKNHKDYEIATINELSSDTITLSAPTQKHWDLGTHVVPAVQAKLQDDSLKGSILNYGLENFNLVWAVTTKENEVINKIGTFTSPTYYNYLVFLWKHNFTEDPSVEIYSPNRIVDFEIGDFILDPRYNFTRVRSTYNYLLKNKSEISSAIGFFKTVNGKQKPFWMPTYANEIQIVGSGSSSSSIITIKDIGYSTYINQNPNQRDIIFIKPDNTYIIRRIVSSSSNNNNIEGTELLTLNEPLGVDWTENTFKESHFLKLVRLDQDSLEVNYITNESAAVSFVMVDSIQA